LGQSSRTELKCAERRWAEPTQSLTCCWWRDKAYECRSADGAAGLGCRASNAAPVSRHYFCLRRGLQNRLSVRTGFHSEYREYGAKAWAKVDVYLRILLSIICVTFVVAEVVLGEWFRDENVPFVPSPTRPR